MRGRIVRVLPCIAVLLLAVPALPQSPKNLQDRVVYRDLRGPVDPVAVVAVLLDSREVPVSTLGQPKTFQADDEWLRRLVVVLRNNTKRNIASALLFIDFPDTQNQGSIGYFVRVGPLPDAERTGRESVPAEKAHPAPLRFEAGGLFNARLDPHFGRIKQAIEARQPITTIKSCKLHLHTFYFDDGTRWMTGQYQRPDPNHPSMFLPMSEAEVRGLLSR